MKNLCAVALLLALLVGCVVPKIGGSKAPFKSPGGLTVLILEDPTPAGRAKLTASQREILHPSKEVMAWCQANCLKDKNGVPDFRLVAADNPMDREPDSKWREAIAVEHPPLPCVIAANGRRGLVAPITGTTTPAQVLAALKRVKGS